MEYADDAVLPDESIESASNRLTNLDLRPQEDAGMKIFIAKTKAQHTRIRKQPKMMSKIYQQTDVSSLSVTSAAFMTYPSKHGLAVHKGRRLYKGRRPYSEEAKSKGHTCRLHHHQDEG